MLFQLHNICEFSDEKTKAYVEIIQFTVQQKNSEIILSLNKHVISAQVDICKVVNALYEFIQKHYFIMSKFFFYTATFSLFASFKKKEGFKIRYKKYWMAVINWILFGSLEKASQTKLVPVTLHHTGNR